MLISSDAITKALTDNNIHIFGSFHLGAHDCEELQFYNQIGLKQEDVVWIDAIPSKVNQAINRGIPNVYNAVVTDKDDEEVIFNISNNVQSSSVLDFGTHAQEHPSVVYVDKFTSKSITIDTFLNETKSMHPNIIFGISIFKEQNLWH